MIYLSRFCMIIMTVMFRHIRIFHIPIKGKKPRDIAAVWKKIISTMSTIIL